MTLSPDALFRTLADITRLRAILLMQSEGELCVCELTHALNTIQPKISRHLAVLRAQGIVLDRRTGQWVHYRLNPELPDWARDVIETTAAGVLTAVPFRDDHAALCGMPNRPGARCCA
jgi:ArsR family transcriptional regulator